MRARTLWDGIRAHRMSQRISSCPIRVSRRKSAWRHTDHFTQIRFQLNAKSVTDSTMAHTVPTGV
jgi:hypothetical protein